MPLQPLLELNPKLEVGEKLSPNLPMGAEGAESDRRVPMERGDLTEWIRKELSQADPEISKFREAGLQCAQFVAGNQYDPETRKILRIERRPDTAFNSVQRFVNYISGVERRTTKALIYQPAVIDNALQQAFGEFMTNAYEATMRSCGGGFERSRAFADMLVTGVGWTDTYITKNRDPKGQIKHVRVPWREMLWPDCSDENMMSTRWRAREPLIDKYEAERRWPKHRALIAGAVGGRGADEFPQKSPVFYTVPNIETEPIDKQGTMPKKAGKVCVTEFQYYDDEDGRAFVDPVTKETVWLSDADFRIYEKRLQIMAPNLRVMADKATHRVYRVAYLLNRKYMLDEPKRLPGDRFSLNCITGHYDEDNRMWYGFVRLLMDPQRYANKFFNQLIEIIGVSAKGGAIVEEGAFTTDAQRHDFENTYGKPGAINIVAEGALKEGKVMPKPAPQMPSGTMEMLQWCIGSMEQVTGISAASLGLIVDPGQTPATLMRQQQQAGLTVLAHEFDSLSRYRLEDEGKTIAAYLGLLADGRLMRIGAPEAPQVIQLLREPFSVEYDLLLDDTEHDPTLRAQYSSFLLEALPALTRQGLFVPQMLDYLPFPVKIRNAIKESMIAQQKEQEAAAKAGINLKGRGTPRDPRETEARIADIRSKAMLHQAKAQSLLQNSRREDVRTLLDRLQAQREERMQHAQHGLEREGHMLERDKLDLDSQKAAAKLMTDMAKVHAQRDAARRSGSRE